MSSTHRIELPQPGNYHFFELPEDVQKQLRALYAAEEMLDYLDGAERDGRGLDTSDDPEDRKEWRNRQRDASDAYRLTQRLRARMELAYFRWAITQWEQTGDESHGKIRMLRALELETDAKLTLLAQEA